MSITKQVESFISGRPSIKDSLQLGLVNYSALSRQICDELKIEKFDAVLIACRRYYWKSQKNSIHEKAILELVKNAKLRVRNKIIVAIIEKLRDMDPIYHLQKKIRKDKGDFNLIEGEDTITLVTNSAYSEEIKKSFRSRIVMLNEKLVQITFLFDPKIEKVSGVVTYVYSLLAEQGINIHEEMSCWTDLMIVIEEKDVAKAMKVLSF
ncbi:ACT domain-containing protein [Candidatus Woesearchaeota archaeon]|nr:ACT domain-containing protein [Candidatus Woesearchaeota archaeon]